MAGLMTELVSVHLGCCGVMREAVLAGRCNTELRSLRAPMLFFRRMPLRRM